MSRHAQRLAERRLALLERSAAQRAALGAAAAPLLERARLLDRALALVRSHPVLAGLGAAGFALLGPRRLLGLLARGLTLYALLKR